MKSLTEDQFDSMFTLVPNHLRNDTGWEVNGQCCLYEGYGKDANYIRSISDTNTVWTYVEGDEGTYLLSGMYFVNRIGYLVSKERYTEDYEVKIDTTGCDEEPETLDQLIAEHGSRIKGFLKD
jgi:hypothetical protein